ITRSVASSKAAPIAPTPGWTRLKTWSASFSCSVPMGAAMWPMRSTALWRWRRQQSRRAVPDEPRPVPTGLLLLFLELFELLAVGLVQFRVDAVDGLAAQQQVALELLLFVVRHGSFQHLIDDGCRDHQNPMILTNQNIARDDGNATNAHRHLIIHAHQNRADAGSVAATEI